MITSILNDDTKKVPKKFHNNGIKAISKCFHLMMAYHNCYLIILV